MPAEQFENEIRQRIRARPFQPFLIVLESGQTLLIDVPKAAINAGGAGVMDAEGEIHLLECEQVREFRSVTEELAR
jgi:hypothetical protein